ncbi:DUF222 domain-containing protein [Microbacterium sp. A82]|uniref:HNH endonuclease signature motif containing protein n=1 Tax=Microbacterium sp. A82 TaxID=3450452 RepID=UPI003F34F228
MTFLAEQLQQIDRHLADALAAGEDVRLVTDGELVTALQTLGRIQRRIDGAIVSATDRVVQRDQGERVTRLSTRAGCRDAVELLRRALRVDGYAARRYVTAATAMHRDLSITSGELLPGAFPELSAALADGELSLIGYLACVVPLQNAARIETADRLAADALLARCARGIDVEAAGDAADAAGERAPAPTTEELAGLTAHIIARLDPDGPEPDDDRAGKRRRHFTIGKLRGGSVPVRGELLPEVAAQLQKLLDAQMNPKIDGEPNAGGRVHFRPSDNGPDAGADTAPAANDGADMRADGLPTHRATCPPVESADLRTHAQRHHDAFATILMVTAASGGMPASGGAAPTLVVSVRAEDFMNRTGRATIEGAGYTVPLGAADHAACAGGVQRVLFDENGAIVGIGTSARIFNVRQRRAIVLRDRKCLIPGCAIRAEWCEIHHVIDHAQGGPTHTDNGVPLCWHHHRTLDENIWEVRMRAGRPEIRGPHWWDPFGKWRSPHLNYEAVDETLDNERERQRDVAWSSW